MKIKYWLSLLAATTLAVALAQIPVGFIGSGFIHSGVQAQSSGLVLLEQHTASSSAELDFTSCITSSYDDYLIEAVALVPSSGNQALYLQASTDGGATYDTGAHYNNIGWGYRPGGGTTNGGSGENQITLTHDSQMSTDPAGVTGSFHLHSPATHAQLFGAAQLVDAGGFLANDLKSQYTQAGMNAFRVLFAASNIASGTVRVYGFAK